MKDSYACMGDAQKETSWKTVDLNYSALLIMLNVDSLNIPIKI